MRARRWLRAVRVTAVVLSAGAALSAGAGAAPAPAIRRAAREAGCLLFTDGAGSATSADCLACHRPGASAGQRRACHPVGIDYAAAARQRPSLRPLTEVVGRGVPLPGRELRCVTCHDRRSPWAFAVALPPGTPAKLQVDAADPRTRRKDPPPPSPGDRVSPAPLCVACHRLG